MLCYVIASCVLPACCVGLCRCCELSVVCVQCDRHLVSTQRQGCSLYDRLRATGGQVEKHQHSRQSYPAQGGCQIEEHTRSVEGDRKCQGEAKAPLIPWVALAHVIARSVNPTLGGSNNEHVFLRILVTNLRVLCFYIYAVPTMCTRYYQSRLNLVSDIYLENILTFPAWGVTVIF